jgi:hypothetical protein
MTRIRISALLAALPPVAVSLQAGVARAETSVPEWEVTQHTFTTNSYCLVAQRAQVRETGSKLSLKRLGKDPWIFWTVPKAADGSVKGAEVLENTVGSLKNRWRIDVPAGSGPRVISMVSLSWSCRVEMRP